MVNRAVIDEILKLQSAREADMMAKTKKALLVMGIGCAVSIAAWQLHIGILHLLGTLWMFLSFAVGIGVFAGTLIRKIATAQFRALLNDRPEQIVHMHSQINVGPGGVQSGTALHVKTMDGKTGSAPFLDADVARASELMRQACPNLRG